MMAGIYFLIYILVCWPSIGNEGGITVESLGVICVKVSHMDYYGGITCDCIDVMKQMSDPGVRVTSE